MQKILAIAGPTASGKTKTAITLAKILNGEIICVDSMQIYKQMDIGTAKVTTEEMEGIKHHLIDIVEPNIPFSVSDYVGIARKTIDQIIENGKLPVLVGGTGLYFESIIYPFNFGGAKTDDSIKAKLYNDLEKYGAEYLHKKLMEIDPIDGEKIHPNNTKRLIRALEIYEITGKNKSDNATDKQLLYDIDMFVLDWDRQTLYDRIAERVQIMFDNGLEAEVKNLINNGITFEMQSMQG
ncbi:MAG: tRNA (adenosine(37)-N6)-dimethylallyltransferase MiaA, partial [Clostridia bacterium]|nr:tRNA (adenosine(37)-N6)-dimethylallyltransferase MiaA [Clostridia bacterium]